jgi:hypothetical protein
MILFPRSRPLSKLFATHLQGGSHGTRDQAQRQRIRSTRSPSILDQLGRCLPKLSDHLDVRRRRYHRVDRRAGRLHDLYCESCETSLPRSGNRSSSAYQAYRATQPSNARVSGRYERSYRDQPVGPRLWLLDLVRRTTGCPSGESDRDSLQQRPDAPSLASRRLFGSSSQAHHEGEARRGCLRNSQKAIASVKKKP